MGDLHELSAGLIRPHEGFSEKAYVCPAGKLTIGYGRNIEDVGISRVEADILLANDISARIADLKSFRFWDELNDARKAALIDMHYNLGPGRFRHFKKMIAALTIGNYSQAAGEMLDSKWAKQVKGRASKLASIIKHGVIQ